MTLTESLAPHLPYLRRYARALTGNQQSGDVYVRAALTALLAGKFDLSNDLPPRVALYRLFHIIWGSSSQFDQDVSLDIHQLTPEERLRSLSSADRAALLLTAVEGFSLSEAGKILGETPEEVEQSIVEAQQAIERQLASRVLIIEDESIIALDLENLVTELGHKVVGTAASKDEAVNKARIQQPGLVLADINLGEGGSGIDAVTEILRSFDIPVIFVTAYPERLLTGERPEPTYLITKPFLPETVQATIGQALFFHSLRREAA
ncbi:MAG TPA: response regulator [Micropepsaceae bacterium]|nr:response regulator [Micropepsaceae bacterium]